MSDAPLHSAGFPGYCSIMDLNGCVFTGYCGFADLNGYCVSSGADLHCTLHAPA